MRLTPGKNRQENFECYSEGNPCQFLNSMLPCSLFLDLLRLPFRMLFPVPLNVVPETRVRHRRYVNGRCTAQPQFLEVDLSLD